MHELDVDAVSAALADRHPQRVQHEARAHVRGELPADDPPREHVDHDAKKTTPSQQRR
jgi:hypothetical protein